MGYSPLIGQGLIIDRSLEIGQLNAGNVGSSRTIDGSTAVDQNAVHAATEASARDSQGKTSDTTHKMFTRVSS